MQRLQISRRQKSHHMRSTFQLSSSGPLRRKPLSLGEIVPIVRLPDLTLLLQISRSEGFVGQPNTGSHRQIPAAPRYAV